MRPPVLMATYTLNTDGVLLLSDVLKQHTIEVQQCKQTEQQLISIQSWLAAQEKINF